MTDERLRDQGRVARQGDPVAEARLLIEQLRAGQLSPEAVTLAARLGHPAAKLARPTTKSRNPIREIALHGKRPIILAVLSAVMNRLHRSWLDYALLHQRMLHLDGMPLVKGFRKHVTAFIKAPDVQIADDLESWFRQFATDGNPPYYILTLGSHLGIQCVTCCSEVFAQPDDARPDSFPHDFQGVYESLEIFIGLDSHQKKEAKERKPARKLMVDAAIAALLPPPP